MGDIGKLFGAWLPRKWTGSVEVVRRGYVGEENIDARPTAQLQLIPKSEKVRGTFPKIFFGSTSAGASFLQQKFMQTQGGWRTVGFSDLELRRRLVMMFFN